MIHYFGFYSLSSVSSFGAGASRMPWMINPRENNENIALITGKNNGPSSVPLLENSSAAWMVELPLLMLVKTSTSMTTGNKTVVERPVTTKIC